MVHVIPQATSSRRAPRTDGLLNILEYVSTLRLGDIENIQARGKARAGSSRARPSPPLSDEELALALFAEEAEGLLNVTKRHLSHRADSSEERSSLLEALTEMEDMARHDHAVAVALSQGRNPPPMPPPRPPPKDPRFLRAIAPSPILQPTRGPTGTSRGVSNNVTNGHNYVRPPRRVRPPAMCTACGDTIDRVVIRTPCGHTYDASCIRTMFELASKDESAFPPTCCTTEIPLKNVEAHLPSALCVRFVSKAREFRTKDRVYCRNPSCAAFIGAATPAPLVCLCTECFQKTCMGCKREPHPGSACTTALDEAVLRLAEAQGWQRCPECRHVVERQDGCNHMTCRCKAQFCYLCAAAWKQCSCPQFGTRENGIDAVLDDEDDTGSEDEDADIAIEALLLRPRPASWVDF